METKSVAYQKQKQCKMILSKLVISLCNITVALGCSSQEEPEKAEKPILQLHAGRNFEIDVDHAQVPKEIAQNSDHE